MRGLLMRTWILENPAYVCIKGGKEGAFLIPPACTQVCRHFFYHTLANTSCDVLGIPYVACWGNIRTGLYAYATTVNFL